MEPEVRVIRIVVAHRRALDRGALAFVLSAEDDLEVVAELEDCPEEVPGALADRRGDVAVVDLELFGPDCAATARAALSLPPGAHALLLAELRHSRALALMMARRAPASASWPKNVPLEQLVSAAPSGRRGSAGRSTPTWR